MAFSAKADGPVAFSCPSLQEMVDYDPASSRPIFAPMQDSSVEISDSSVGVKILGVSWGRTLVRPLPESEKNPLQTDAEYVLLLFGETIHPSDIIEVNGFALSQVLGSPQSGGYLIAYEIRTASKIYRYVQFDHADLAVCR